MATDTNQTGKLEADLFGAEDLDGMTESLMGSGSLNYLVLQSQQTDLAAMTTNGDPENTGETGLTNLGGGTVARLTSPQETAGQARDFQMASADAGDLSAALASGAGIARAVMSDTTSTGGQNSTQSYASAEFESQTTSFSNTGFTSKSSVETGLRGAPGESGQNGSDGVSGSDGSNGNNGSNGANGQDGGGDGGPDINTDINIVIDTDVDIDVVNNLQVNLGDVTNTVINILDWILPDNPQDPNDTDLVVDLGLIGPIDLQQQIDVLLDPVENIMGDIDINIVPDIDLGNGVVSLEADALLAGISLPPVDLDIDAGTLLTESGIGGVVETLQDTATNLVDGLPIDPLVGDLLAPPPAGGDTDLMLGLGATPLDDILPSDVHVPLDIAESIVGDIDLNVAPEIDLSSGVIGLDAGGILADMPLPEIGISTEDLGVDQVIADVIPQELESLADDILSDGGNDILGLVTEAAGIEEITGDEPFAALNGIVEGITGETGSGQDSDLVVNLDAALPVLDTGLLGLSDTSIDIPLDPVETVTGDIDLELDSAIDLLAGGDLLTLNAESTGTGEGGIWPENPVVQTVDQLIDALPQDGLGLTQETGSVSEGLGLLDLTESNIVGGGGSSGGGGLFGGLFG